MSLASEIASLSQKALKSKDLILTEEATKNALVMPMLKALGYDIFDPCVVIPEFISDLGIKKGEKVDYALKVNGNIAILMECKGIEANLCEVHASQLYRYFSVTEARFGILTNGIQYWFYSDLDEPNKMDKQPFFCFNLLSYRDAQISELEKFSHNKFDLDGIMGAASTLKYISLVMVEARKELESPSEEMVRLFAKRVYDGNYNQNVRDKFIQIVSHSIRETIKDIVSQRLKDALRDTNDRDAESMTQSSLSASPVETTEEEIDAVRIIKAIACEIVDPERIVMRDAKSYCAVLLDDNNRKPIVRLYLSNDRKRIGLFSGKIEQKFNLDKIGDIYKYSTNIKESILEY